MEAAHFFETSGKALYLKSFNNPENDNLETVSVNMVAGVLMPKCFQAFIKSVSYKSQCTRWTVDYRRETINVKEYSFTIEKSSTL